MKENQATRGDKERRGQNVPATEEARASAHGIDRWESGRVLSALLADQAAAIEAVEGALPALEALAEAARPKLARGGRLVFAGAGTSGRIAVQDGVELTPTFGWPRERLVLLIAGGDAALTRSVEGAEDDPKAGRRAVREASIGEHDVVIALAASGRTPFTVGVIEAAAASGALTGGFASNAGTPLLAGCEHPVLLDTGAELIAGSTRMKAGTAQKIALNLLTSLLMIRLGHVHDGYMVDLEATNTKLEHRRCRIVAAIAGCSLDEAEGALMAGGGSIKQAVLMCSGLSAEEAERALVAAKGHLRTALERVGEKA